MPPLLESSSKLPLSNLSEFRQRLPLQWVVADLPDSWMKIMSLSMKKSSKKKLYS